MRGRIRKVALLTVLFASLGGIFFPFNANAATSSWTQSDWSGGVGDSTENQYVSETGVLISAGEMSLDHLARETNGDFETAFDEWAVGDAYWWLSGGSLSSEVVAVYQPQWATSLANSYINLSNPGTNDAAPGVAPTWAAADGWTFNGTTQYLTTGVVPGASHSVLATFANSTQDDGTLLGAQSLSGDYELASYPTFDELVYYYGRNSVTEGVADGANGTIALTGVNYSYNGVVINSFLPDDWTDFPPALFIGCLNANGSPDPSYYYAGDIHAIAVYNVALSDAELLAVHNAIAGLTGDSAYENASTVHGGATSAKVVTVSAFDFVQSIDVGDTEDYTLEAYVYTDGSAVTDADAELYVDSAAISTTYEDAGSGWYMLSADITGVNGATDYGVEVKAGKTVYVDDFSLWEYEEEGVITSNIYDTGGPSTWGLGSWVDSGDGGEVQLRIRTSNDPTMAGAPDFSTCAMIGNGSDFSANGCSTDGDRYVQYQVTLVRGSSPNLGSITLNYERQALDGTGQSVWPIAVVGIGMVAPVVTVIVLGKPKNDGV